MGGRKEGQMTCRGRGGGEGETKEVRRARRVDELGLRDPSSRTSGEPQDNGKGSVWYAGSRMGQGLELIRA